MVSSSDSPLVTLLAEAVMLTASAPGSSPRPRTRSGPGAGLVEGGHDRLAAQGGSLLHPGPGSASSRRPCQHLDDLAGSQSSRSRMWRRPCRPARIDRIARGADARRPAAARCRHRCPPRGSISPRLVQDDFITPVDLHQLDLDDLGCGPSGRSCRRSRRGSRLAVPRSISTASWIARGRRSRAGRPSPRGPSGGVEDVVDEHHGAALDVERHLGQARQFDAAGDRHDTA